MTVAVIVGIVGVLVLGSGAALFAGARSDHRHRSRAWSEIAHDRRQLWEERQQLDALRWDLELCRGCPLRPPQNPA
jgi:hypothetical protein